MNDKDYNIYNNLYNQYQQTGNAYLAMAFDFLSANMQGFYRFAYNEAMERWKKSKYIAMHLIRNERKPTPAAMPAPATGFPNAKTAIDTALTWEQSLVGFINTSFPNIEISEQYTFGKLLKYAIKEHHEILGIQKKMLLPGADDSSINSELYSDYAEYFHRDYSKFNNPCGYKKS